MKTVKIVSLLACAKILLLTFLLANLEDPLKANYRNTLHDLMELENLQSEREVLSKYPALSEAKTSISKADILKSQICSKSSGLAPSLKRKDEAALRQLQRDLLNTRKNAERLLNEMKSKTALIVMP